MRGLSQRNPTSARSIPECGPLLRRVSSRGRSLLAPPMRSLAGHWRRLPSRSVVLPFHLLDACLRQGGTSTWQALVADVAEVSGEARPARAAGRSRGSCAAPRCRAPRRAGGGPGGPPRRSRSARPPHRSRVGGLPPSTFSRRKTKGGIAPPFARSKLLCCCYCVAASALTMPEPNCWRLPITSAVVFSQERTSPGVQSGCIANTHAATALTCGVAMEVPAIQ